MSDALTGTSLHDGGYVLGEALGRGGTACVYRARRASDSTQVAAKVVTLDNIETVDALVDRYKGIARLSHPHILPIYDVGISDQLLFVITPLAEEGSLRQLMQRERVTPEFAVRLVSQIADALQHLHNRGIVHLDVKPANILLTAGGRPLLGDFGLLALEPGPSGRVRVRGTPAYMSPEQCRLEPVGPASDQYSLAITSFELLTGHRPFSGSSPGETLLRQSAEPPPSPRSLQPSLPAEADAVVLKALAKYPQERFPSVTAFARALSKAMVDVPPGPPPEHWPEHRVEASEEATLQAVTLELAPSTSRSSL